LDSRAYDDEKRSDGILIGEFTLRYIKGRLDELSVEDR
jgi:hypothetical protein